MANVLIVDDEPDILELLSLTLSRMKHHAIKAADITQAKAQLQSQSIDLCLTDMNLPDGSGMDLVKHIQADYERTPVVMITAHGSIDTAIEAMKAGAFDFLSKPVELDKLRNIITHALTLNAVPEPNQLENQAPGIIGQSEAVKRLNQQIHKVSRSHAPVFIHGESGSGKELVARAIHQLGARAEHPFVAVNCGAIPTELMESEFFGHKKGSFTGASATKEGFFQAANGGTLFLDEVADLPLAMQVKLLRAIQEGSIRPVGSETETPVDVRILSASHKDLELEVAEQNFRQDLYYRLDVINLPVPPLKDRIEDLPLLVSHINKRLCEALDVNPVSVSKAALRRLETYMFPGNVRELENILQRAITLCDGGQIDADDLQLKAPLSKAARANEASLHQLAPGEMLDDYLEEAERQIIEQALEATRWNKTAAAELLGMSFRSMRYRLKKLGID